MKEKISEYLASLTDKEIKSLDLRSDALSPLTVITSYAKILAHFRASQKALQLEHFNLLHRVLKLSTYNGRMFALNEIMTQLNSTTLCPLCGCTLCVLCVKLHKLRLDINRDSLVFVG